MKEGVIRLSLNGFFELLERRIKFTFAQQGISLHKVAEGLGLGGDLRFRLIAKGPFEGPSQTLGRRFELGYRRAAAGQNQQ